MDLDLSKSGLEKHYNKEELIRKTALQVIKDFALFGQDITFPKDIKYAYQELFVQLNKQIEDLLALNSQKLLSLLYQIDISEKKIQRVASYSPETPLSEVVSELIIERELKKVLTRMYFSQQR